MANLTDLLQGLNNAERKNAVDTIIEGKLLATNPTSLFVNVPARVGDIVNEVVDSIEKETVVTQENVGTTKISMRKHSVIVELAGMQKQDLLLENSIPVNLDEFIGKPVMVTVRQITLDKTHTSANGTVHPIGTVFTHIVKVVPIKESFDFKALLQQMVVGTK